MPGPLGAEPLFHLLYSMVSKVCKTPELSAPGLSEA